MLNLVSIAIGLAALVGAVVAFLPLLGWLNWFVLPVAVVGLGLGVMAGGRAGRNLNIAVLVIGVVRLSLGGGIF